MSLVNPVDVAQDADLAAESITHFGANAVLAYACGYEPVPVDVLGNLCLPNGRCYAVCKDAPTNP